MRDPPMVFLYKMTDNLNKMAWVELANYSVFLRPNQLIKS